MKTYLAKQEETNHGWVLIDVKDQPLGRVATAIANILRGKDKATYTPHVDTGNHVVVINAAQIKLTGNKWEDKIYYSHSGYTGNLKEITADKLREKQPEQIIIKAVKGMLPKNDLSRKILKKLKVYPDDKHPHQAGQPKQINL